MDNDKSGWQIARERALAEIENNKKILAEYRATHAPTLSEQKCLDITITARRWFARTYGNTYHSVTVTVGMGQSVEFRAREPYAYGYGEQYLQTAFSLLQAGGIFPKTERRLNGFDVDYSEFLDAMREKKHNFYINVSDVARKRDL